MTDTTPTLPHEFASPDTLAWGLDGAFIPGPQSVYGETLDRRTDGGGAWLANLSDIPLLSTDSARSWEALMLRWYLGDTKIIVPRCAGRIRAAFILPGIEVPHSDETPFSDDTEYLTGGGNPTLSAGVSLRATQAVLTIPPGDALSGAEAFTLVGPIFGARLYGIVEILDITGDQATIRFGPPAREDYASGAEVDFRNPRCTMRPVLSQLAGGWPQWDTAWQSSVAMTFRETFR